MIGKLQSWVELDAIKFELDAIMFKLDDIKFKNLMPSSLNMIASSLNLMSSSLNMIASSSNLIASSFDPRLQFSNHDRFRENNPRPVTAVFQSRSRFCMRPGYPRFDWLSPPVGKYVHIYFNRPRGMRCRTKLSLVRRRCLS